MRAGKSGEYESAGIGASLIHLHTGQPLIGLRHRHQIGEIQLRIHSLAVHIECQSYNVYISRSFPVPEQGSLHAVAARQNRHLRRSHPAASIIVRVNGKRHLLTKIHVLTEIGNLGAEHMRHRYLHGRRDIDDHLFVFLRLPDIQNGVAYL